MHACVWYYYFFLLSHGTCVFCAKWYNVCNLKKLQDEKELLENNCCPMHLKPCVLRKEDNYFFALSKYQKLLEETLTKNPDFVQPSFRLNEVRQ